ERDVPRCLTSGRFTHPAHLGRQAITASIPRSAVSAVTRRTARRYRPVGVSTLPSGVGSAGNVSSTEGCARSVRDGMKSSMISPPPTGPADPLATAKPRPIVEIAARLGLQPDEIEPYGRFKAKLPLERVDLARAARSKLILISAVTPTPAGEGKTTTSIGLADGLARLGKRAVAVLREPSLGPVFGMKGGATGGGRARIVPHADINLHFNSDFSAVEKAHNLLGAIVDNHLHSRKSTLDLDPLSIRWKRVVDMNDRSLRRIVIGLGGQGSGVPRESGFDITAASEVMAILCL